MICPTCQAEGKTSTIRIGERMTTLMYCAPFYDEQGAYHHHDLNIKTQSYSCSQGHAWDEKSRTPCPSCVWPEKAAAP